MRVRRFELRLIATGLVVAWAAAAAVVILTYRPGGPLDLAVGLAMLVPIAISGSALIWPPVARGEGAFPLMVSLGAGSLLVLLPSIGGVLEQLLALGSRTLMPSLEAAYPWFLALAGTSLFSGFGLARRLDGGMALRRRRFVAGFAMATTLTLAAGGLFAGVTIANELALRDRPSTGPSRFGPTGLDHEPVACDARISAGPAARVVARYAATANLRPIGSVDLAGLRSGTDLRWLAYVATSRELGQYGSARRGDRAWSRTPAIGWDAVAPAAVADATVDLRAVEIALTDGNRATAEDRGVEVLEGASARRCRIAVDGATFLAAFPQVRWLVGPATLDRWRGQVDYWIFLDDQVGQIAGTAGGEAVGIRAEALQATVEVHITATERHRDFVIYPPAP
ncbi:MAG: hypothetical protein WEG56_13370 [Chloroflexota bacterium]